MSRVLRIAPCIRPITGEDVETTDTERIVSAGDPILILTRTKGTLAWRELRYGMTFREIGAQARLVWNARDDQLKEIQRWSMNVRQRWARPISAYADSRRPDGWHIHYNAWVLGLFEPTNLGGAVVITTDGAAGRTPLLTDERSALAWLGAEQWDAFPLLNKLPRL